MSLVLFDLLLSVWPRINKKMSQIVYISSINIYIGKLKKNRSFVAICSTELYTCKFNSLDDLRSTIDGIRGFRHRVISLFSKSTKF